MFPVGANTFDQRPRVKLVHERRLLCAKRLSHQSPLDGLVDCLHPTRDTLSHQLEDLVRISRDGRLCRCQVDAIDGGSDGGRLGGDEGSAGLIKSTGAERNLLLAREEPRDHLIEAPGAREYGGRVADDHEVGGDGHRRLQLLEPLLCPVLIDRKAVDPAREQRDLLVVLRQLLHPDHESAPAVLPGVAHKESGRADLVLVDRLDPIGW
mmetsp:Transcript_62780/g.139779  ORF Transcript_62780/g.139779 Transcript_62780/m.139779 type:complete len:209 (-) Transcript_62780:432-1058(-)